jgi:hypothetical protein
MNLIMRKDRPLASYYYVKALARTARLSVQEPVIQAFPERRGTTLRSNFEPTSAEVFVSILLASVAGLIAALVGFMGGIFLAVHVVRDPDGESALLLAPATALGFGVIMFILTFRYFIRYGNPQSGDD